MSKKSVPSQSMSVWGKKGNKKEKKKKTGFRVTNSRSEASSPAS